MSKQLFSGSVGRKFAMALSALFLIIFLLQHFMINFTSVLSEETFNELSHFMGTNPVIQFVMQPILMFGVVFHFIMGFILEIKNRNSRAVKYAKNNGAANSSWMSRNMIWSGLFILLFLFFHFYDFWIPEMNYKYIEFKPEDPNRYYEEVVHMFASPGRVIVYSLSFVFLALHLLHGFQSAFQSMGARHDKYTPAVQKIGRAYAILIPAGFIFIAVFHYVNSL
ncbi:succinate dehydrogenase cytochrome b subunit [Ekhidna sp. To15]|uniref:succinate dehydrogenase cytochrome b subunit n=1 Tax=Ekhidna sp. To15 TaxID=3395267 RepID=UPI003F51DD74